MRTRVSFLVAIFALFVVLLINGALNLSTDAMLFPYILGALGFALLAWQTMREVKGRQQETSGEKPETAGFSPRTYLPGVAWLLAILPMVYLLGFLVTIPLYIFICLKFRGEKWLLSLVITITVGVFFYFALFVALKVPFYEGLLFS